MTDGGHWRWNSDIAWHYFSSMQYEAHCAKNADNDFMKYHHLRSCIYFGIGTLEAFLNKQIRLYFENDGGTENDIAKAMFHSTDDKLKKWVKRIYGAGFSFEKSLISVFACFKDMRNEITHPKNRDHSIYAELDACNPESLVEAVARGIVMLHEAKSTPFPYWLLGWNYVGMNGNSAHPFEGNNGNGFVHSFRGMFEVSPRCFDFERDFMTSIRGYEDLKKALDGYPHDIEPFWSNFPLRPRLCRRWWDHAFIRANTPTDERGAGA